MQVVCLLILFAGVYKATTCYNIQDIDVCTQTCECVWCMTSDSGLCFQSTTNTRGCEHVIQPKQTCAFLREWTVHKWKEGTVGKIVLNIVVLMAIVYFTYSTIVCMLYESQAPWTTSSEV